MTRTETGAPRGAGGMLDSVPLEVRHTSANAAARTLLGPAPPPPPGKRRRDPYAEAGSHPEVVARVWNFLGEAMPEASRGLLDGRPVLVHPGTAIPIAIPIATTYAIWVAPDDRPFAEQIGLRSTWRWETGEVTDLRDELSDGWYFGRWRTEERTLCRRSYHEIDRSQEG